MLSIGAFNALLKTLEEPPSYVIFILATTELSDNGIFRKRNKDGSIWSLSLSASVFYLTPAASEGYRSTLKPAAFRDKSPSFNLSAQVIRQEQPLSEIAALNPDWVEWLMGFPPKWTDASYGVPSPKESPA